MDNQILDNNIEQNDSEELINFRELFDKVLKHWKLFPIAFFVCFALAFVYLKTTTPQYSVSSKVLFEGDSDAGLNQKMSLLGGLQMSTNSGAIEDNIYMLRALSLSTQMVKQLHLNVQFFDNSGFIRQELYGKTNPILLLTAPLLQDTIQSALEINVKRTTSDKKDQVTITYKKKEYSYTTNSLSQGIKTDFGDISIAINPLPKEYDYVITISPLASTAKAFAGKLSVVQISDWSSMLNISMIDNVPERAIDAIDKIVELFNTDAVNDKNAIVQATASFIDARLQLLSEELGDVEQYVETYKRQNQLTDVNAQASMFMGMTSDIERRRMDVETQMNIIQSVENFLNQNSDFTVVPNNVGVNDATLTAITGRYNEMVLERERLLRSTNPDNPIIIELESRLTATRANLISSIKNIKNSIDITRNDIYSQIGQNSAKIGEIPTQERQLMEIKRQQQVKEALFLFLLQKREETTLSMAVDAQIIKTIDSAMRGAQTAPNSKVIWMAAFLLAILIPLGIIYVLSLLNNKIESRTELERKCIVPIIGEICKKDGDANIVIEEGKNTPIIEMFRLIRTNLQFMLTNQTHKIITVTSTVSGEGKTFNAVNLALSLALTNKKVVIVGMDIRSPQLFKYFDLRSSKGVVSYLTDLDLKVDDVIQPSNVHNNLQCVSSGPIPPNPSELLLSPRVDDLFKELSAKFDYVILDTAPVALVSDTLLINRVSNLTIYICRENYSLKESIDYVNEYKRANRLTNLCVLINDCNLKKTYGYSYGYTTKPSRGTAK
jgi:capsular exopolysaccharide synthesis family protein